MKKKISIIAILSLIILSGMPLKVYAYEYLAQEHASGTYTDELSSEDINPCLSQRVAYNVSYTATTTDPIIKVGFYNGNSQPGTWTLRASIRNDFLFSTSTPIQTGTVTFDHDDTGWQYIQFLDPPDLEIGTKYYITLTLEGNNLDRKFRTLGSSGVTPCFDYSTYRCDNVIQLLCDSYDQLIRHQIYTEITPPDPPTPTIDDLTQLNATTTNLIEYITQVSYFYQTSSTTPDSVTVTTYRIPFFLLIFLLWVLSTIIWIFSIYINYIKKKPFNS